MTPRERGQTAIGTIQVASGTGFRIMTPIPWRLHEILEDIEHKNMSWIVSWMSGGKSFQVLDHDRFEDTILPAYFHHSKYKSFQVPHHPSYGLSM